MLSSDAIILLLAVIDQGSFSAAARTLGRVPSAVSMAIAQLEAELGIQLFDRSSRDPVPTEALKALEPQARAIIYSLEQMQRHAHELSLGLESRLSLALEPELQTFNWAEPLKQLAHKFPSLQVEMIAAPQADAIAMLHSGRVQLALTFERTDHDPREAFEEIAIETMVIVMAPHHPFAQLQRPLNTDDLEQSRQIIVSSRDVRQLDRRRLIARQYWLSDSYAAALTMILSGLGWGVVPLSLAQPHLEAATLLRAEVAHMTNALHWWIDVVWSRKFPQGMAAREFIRLATSAHN